MKQHHKFLFSLVGCVLFLYGLASAENESRASLYYMLQNWKTTLSDTSSKLNQGVFGLSAMTMLNDKFRFDLLGSASSTNLTPPSDTKSKLSSLNDTRLRGTYYISGGTASASFFANLPTGKVELDDEQYLVATAIADNSLKFATRRVGQGLDLGTEWLVLPKIGQASLQIGGGYLFKGKYKVRKNDTDKYKYGDEISGIAGITVEGKPLSYSGNVVLKYYMKDKFADKEVFQAGIATLFNAVVSYNDLFNLYGGLSLLNRGKAKVRTTTGEEQLTDEASRSARNELLLYAGGSYPVTEKFQALGRLEVQNVSANDYDKIKFPVSYRPKSHYFGFGAGAGYALTEMVSASGLISFYTGKISDNIDLSGLGLSLVLTVKAR